MIGGYIGEGLLPAYRLGRRKSRQLVCWQPARMQKSLLGLESPLIGLRRGEHLRTVWPVEELRI